MSLAERTCRLEEVEHGVLSVTLRPELNSLPWNEIDQLGSAILSRIHSRDKPQVIVDLTELAHMGSAMVALVVRIWKATEERGGRMVVINRGEVVDEVLKISGLSSRWTIVPDRQQAFDALSLDQARRQESSPGDTIPAACAVASATLVLLTVLGVLDLLFSGVVTARTGHDRLAAATLISAVLAFALAVVAVVRGVGVVRMVGVCLLTLSLVLCAGSALLMTQPAGRGLANAGPAAEPPTMPVDQNQ